MNLRKRFFLMFTLIFVAVAIAACNANNIVTLAFSDDAYTVKVGDTVNPDVNIEAGSNYDANTIAKQLVFSSNNESVVKVVDGELLAVGIGDATIKVQWSEKAIVFTTAKVRVLTNVAPKVVLTDYSPNMLKGAEQTIKYEFDEKYTDATVRWESANEDVVTVDQNGKVTALAVGEATVIAYAVVGESEQSTVVKITVTESDFAINYVLDGGVNDEANPAGFNTLLLPVELKDPTKAGYKFEGWYLDSEFSQKVTSIVAGTAEDVTLYAKWSVADYNVTYVLDGGVNAEANPATVKMADSVTLQDASKEGFEFQGWYTEETFENKVEKLENVTSDVTLYAKFEEIVITDYAINYDLDGGRFDAEYYTVAEFEKDFLKDFNAQAGYDFDSAASLDTEYLGGTKFGNFFLDEAMFAKWSWMLKGIYAVVGGAETLDPAVADFTNNTVRAYYLCNINAYLTGTSHKDTYYEKQSFDFSDLEKQAVVTSYSEPKSGGAPKSYTAGVGLETLPTPIKDGFAFTGWVDGEGNEVTSIAATQKGEVNLKATWESAIGKEYAINYDLDGGKFDIEIEYYTVAEFEKDFIKDFNAQTGYDLDDAASLDTEYLGGTKFGNFFLDEAMFAKWSWMLKGIYAVVGGDETLDPAVADFTNNTVRAYYLCNINAYLTGTSHKDTYYEKQSFDFSDAEKQAVVTSYSEPKSGGVVASYVAGTGLETLPTPVKEGYKFTGWVDGEGKEVTAISATHTGEVNLKATWEEPSSEEFKINYELNGGYFLLPYVYQNHEEMVRDFVKDFNAFSGKTVTVTITDGHVTCDFFGRSWMSDNSSLGYNFLTSADYSAKWGWMLDVINENRVARGKAELSSEDGQAEARGDVHNFLCLCAPGEFDGNASFGGDYSNYSFLTYASKLAKVEGVLEAPTSYKSGEETLIPDPVKEEYTFINWAGDAVATIETTGNGNFWSYYASTIFLYNSSSLNNPTFSFRVGLMLNSNGTYRVDRVAQSGASFTSAGLDAEIIISEQYEGWAGTAAVRSAIKVGQTAVIDGSLATGVATVKFYDLEERPVALTYETTSNTDFWTTYTTGKFLFNQSNAQNPLYSYRVGIAKKLDGTYYVDRIGANGQSGVKYDGLAYIIVVSSSHTEYASEEAKLKNVKVGQIVEFDGDPDSGACTVKFINNYTVIPADAEGDLNLNALFVQLKDENALSFNANGGKLSEGAPDMYLTSTGLDLANVTASKDGYTFKGWSLDGKLITNIPTGKRGDLVLVASYEPIEYKIEYELNGGVFSVDSIEYIYADFASLVADFLADYEAKYGLSGLTSGNFFSKSNSYGLVGFFKDETLSAKWNWLVEFMLNYNSVYSGLNYMKNASSASNYNKYWRANLAAFMQKSKITSPLSMDFSNLDEAKFFEDNVPTKVVTVAANPAYVYTVDQLPLELAEPTKEGKKFVGFYFDEQFTGTAMTELPVGTLGDVKLYARFENEDWVQPVCHTITFNLDGGELENAPTQYEEGKGLTLPKPVKDGYKFLGWSLEEGSTKYVVSISETDTTDIVLYANWEESSAGPRNLYVGEGQDYPTIELAMADANDGDTIFLTAGQYAGATIDKQVVILGPNAGINPNLETRSEEAVVTSDLLIAADGVVIDGIQLTAKGRIITTKEKDVYGLKVTYVLIDGSTVNDGNVNNTAPIHLAADATTMVYDVEFSQSLIRNSASRPMIMFIEGVENLSVTDNVFDLVRSNYNDGIKTNNDRACISGNVDISRNIFNNLAQYSVWFRGYGAGNYILTENEFNHIGTTGGYLHGAFTFNTYKGDVIEDVNILIQNNKVSDGLALLRIDNSDKLTADHTAIVKYNTLESCVGPQYINNASKMTVICDSNYWGEETPADSKFVGVKERTNDLASADDVPSPDEVWFLDKITVGEGKDYATLTDALAAANDGDSIVVFPGTYDENVIVNKSVNIYGLNHGIAGAPDRLNEAVFIKSFTISADDVIIDGLRFEEKGNIILSDVSRIELLNFVMLADVTKVGSDSRSGQLVNTGALTDITIDGAYFSTGDKAVSGRNCIVFCDFVTTNLTIQNSYFGNEVEMANPDFYSDCIKVTKLAGEIIIRDCQLRFTTDNFNIFIGGVSNEATKILLQDNVFGGFESTANGTAGLAVRNLPAEGQLDIIHNVMEHMNGTVLSFNGGKGYVSVLYNVFDENTELKNSLADCNVTFVGNIYKKAPVSGSEPSDLNVVKDVEELEELYQAYLEEISKIKDTILNYELDGAYVAEELPEVHVYNEETKLPTPYKEGYKFLGWTIEEGSDKFITSIAPKVKDEELTLYANFAYMCILVGEGGTYATISEALKNAKEFDVIKVLPGTYDEDVVVDVNYIRIEGANAGVDYEGERGEESIVKSMKIVANSRNIIIDGFKFSNPECLQIEKANNINVLNSIFGATATADNTSMIYGVGSIDGLTVEGCLFTANNRTHYRAIRLEYSAAYFKNINILHNKFVNTADASTYIDCVKIADVTGDLNITANEFDWAGNNWTVFIGGGSLSGSNVHISFNFNTFGSERDQNQSGATFRNLKADTTLDVIGNVFSKVGGNVLQTKGGTAAYVTVRDNAFMDTSAKVGMDVLADNLVFENNYAFTDWTSSGSIDLSQFTNAETSDAALEDLDVFAIGYVVKPGALFTGFQDGSVKGSSVNVSKFIPTLSGYRFVGWHLKEDLSDDVVNHVHTTEDIVILYAEYEKLPVHTITYELDGGELAKPVTSVVDDCVLKLAEPTKFASTFLGWSLEQGSTEYVDKLTVTEDVTLYANWLNEVVYDVKLVLNGGSARYASRADVVEDFINDYNKLMGTTWASAADIPSGNFDPVKWHTFYGMELNAKQTVRDKWLWLAKYLLRVSSAQLASNNCNVTGLTHLVNNAAMSGDDIYGLLYAFRSFLQGGIARPGSSYTSVDFSVYENANSFWPELSEAEPTDRQFTATEKLPDAFLENYKFDGWYLNPEYTGEKVEHISGACTLYAKFVEENPVTEVTITNKITEIVKFNTLQLEWKLNPEEALIKNVRFTSSDESVATVDAFGLVTTLKEGNVTITITSDSGSHPTDFVTFEVYSPKHFEVSYQTESYTTVGGELQLNAELIDRDGSKSELVWSTEDSSIVSVDQNGKVTALGKGMAKVTVADKNNGSFAYDFYVTVLDDELSEAVQAVVDAHNSNTFTRYDLGIGAGKPAYYRDIIGAVSDIMYNEDYEPDTKYYVDGTGYESASFYEGPKSSVEWICIHYTGNMSKGATAAANADYFHSGGGGTSINYVVGNDGIFHVIDDKYIAYHAGDGTTVPFEWFDAGIDYVAGDPQYAVPGIAKVDDKYYYTLNGKTSKVEVADWKATVTTNAQNSPTSAYHVFESDYANPKWFNDLGLPVKVENGKYYIGTTWWCYTQVLEGRICSRGGNRNSVGIESCVNPEADLWYTWQKLAQLTAYLMDKYDLDITRVKMHHFFSGKDCHQPFLANNDEIWWVFIDSVLAEYNRTYVLDNAKFEMTVNAEDQNIIDKFGRVTVPDYAKTIRYTVKVTVGDQVQEITLATAVNGIFAK